MGLMTKNILQLIKRMTTSSLFWTDDFIPRKSTKIHQLEEVTMVTTKLDALTKKLERMDMKAIDVAIRCKICEREHINIDCSTINAFPNEKNQE